MQTSLNITKTGVYQRSTTVYTTKGSDRGAHNSRGLSSESSVRSESTEGLVQDLSTVLERTPSVYYG